MGTALPGILDAVVLDARTQSGFAASPIIELSGAAAGANVDGLRLIAGSNGSTIRSLVINRFTRDGIQIQASTNNMLLGNYIGTDVTGTVDQRDLLHGIRLESNSGNNSIGGGNAGEGNVVSGNNEYGLVIDASSDNSVVGNRIGTNAAGTASVGNNFSGILVIAGSTDNQIGGSGTGEGNFVSGNSDHGGYIHGAATQDNHVKGNLIGTDISGTNPLGNANHGVIVLDGINNVIGGTGAGEANTISANGAGINVIGTGSGNSLLSNLIYGNGGLGIDLGVTGVTANDLGGGDIGANDLQNFQVLLYANSDGAGSVNVIGTLNSDATTDNRIEFFASNTADGSGHGEAARFLGSINVTTDGSGDANFNANLAVIVAEGEFTTSTATEDLGGGSYRSTSEFGANLVASTTNDAPSVTALASALAATEQIGLGIEGIGFGVSDSDEANLGAFDTLSVGEGGMTIGVDDVNEAPFDIAPDSFVVNELIDTTGGHSVGGLSATDADGGETFTYSIVGGADAARFSIGGIGGDELLFDDGALDYESQSTYNVTVRVNDSGGLTYDETVSVLVINFNDQPVVSVPATQFGAEDVPVGIVGVMASDPDGNLQSVQLSATDGQITLALQGGATFSGGENGTSTVTIVGSEPDINDTLSTLVYVGNANQFGIETITVVAVDTDAAVQSAIFQISLVAVNDQPVAVPDDFAIAADDILSAGNNEWCSWE